MSSGPAGGAAGGPTDGAGGPADGAGAPDGAAAPSRGAGAGDQRASENGDVLARLRELLREQGGLMATLLAPGPQAAAVESPAALAAAGPRAEGRRAEYELLVEAIFEGYLLHYGEPRIVTVGEADLRLLAGDQLYATGLARLVALGDTLAVSELADTITLSALAQGAQRPELADAVWVAGAHAVGWGPTEEHRRAKELVCAGSPEGIEAMRTSALAVSATG